MHLRFKKNQLPSQKLPAKYQGNSISRNHLLKVCLSQNSFFFFPPEQTKKTHLLLLIAHHFRSNSFESTLTVRYCQSCCPYFVLNSFPSNVRKVNLRNATLCLKNILFTYLKIFLLQDLLPPPDKEGSTDVQVEVRKTLWFRLEKIKKITISIHK